MGNPNVYQRLSLQERIDHMQSNINKRLLQIINKKKTCLCLAIDCTNSNELLQFAEKAASYVCAIKVHVDILDDFDEKFVTELTDLATKNDFLIFEDRKFADTGHTVELQATAGKYEINRWAHLVTVHALPGQPILDAFRRVIQKQESVLKGCLLIAELSTEGALTNSEVYLQSVLQLAAKNTDVVSGFICQKRVSCDPSFLYWTPGILWGEKNKNSFIGINVAATTDGAGQKWRTIDKAIVEDGNDIIIVGRALTQSSNFEKDIVKYRDAAWIAVNNFQ